MKAQKCWFIYLYFYKKLGINYFIRNFDKLAWLMSSHWNSAFAVKCKFRGEEQLLGPCLNCMKILHCIVCARVCVLLHVLMHCHEWSMEPCIMDVVEKKLQILVILFFVFCFRIKSFSYERLLASIAKWIMLVPQKKTHNFATICSQNKL